jgi:Rha family phage regulatory protein
MGGGTDPMPFLGWNFRADGTAGDRVRRLFGGGVLLFANSRDVAEYFQKRHDNVLRDIDNILKTLDSSILRNHQFIEAMMPDGSGVSRRTFDMTRDGFTLLAMGFTGGPSGCPRRSIPLSLHRSRAACRDEL